MANNPLYPGYSPGKKGEEPINPLYPGYYSGQPLPKRPQSREYLQPVEFDFDIIAQQIDDVGETIANTPLGPKWVLDRVVDDWKANLKVSINPAVENRAGTVDVTELDDYATDDLAGAQTTLSLSPKDWGITGDRRGWEQAKKQAVKTLKGWLKETTGVDTNNIFNSNFSDIQNKANEALWLNALGYKEQTSTKLQEKAGKAIAKSTTAYFKNIREEGAPLNIKGVSAKEIKIVRERDGTERERTIYHKDLYRDVAKNAADFERNRDNFKARDSKHIGFLSEAFQAVDVEIMDKYRNNQDSPTLIKHRAAVELFHTKVDTLRAVEELQTDLSGRYKITHRLKQISLGLSDEDPKELLDYTYQRVTRAESTLNEYTEKVKGLKSQGIPDSQISKFIDQTEKYQRHIGHLKGRIDKAKKLAEKGELKSKSTKLKETIKMLEGSTPGKNFKSRTTFRDNLAGDLRKDLERTMLSREDYDIGSLLNDKDLEAEGIDLRAKKIAPLTRRLRQDRIHYATKEVLDSFDAGGVAGMAEAYIWNQIKKEFPKRLERITSGDLVGNTLRRTNYFGLKIDENYGVPNPIKNPKRFERFNKKWGHKADVELSKDVKLILGQSKMKVTGIDVKGIGFELGGIGDENKPTGAGGLGILGEKQFKNFFKLDSTNKEEAVKDKILFAKLLNNDRREETLNELTQKMFGKNLSELDKEDNYEILLGKFEKAGEWIEQKTGGKIKVLPKQEIRLNLGEGFTKNSVDLPDGSYLNLFQNEKLDLFLKKGLSKKDEKEQLQQLKRLLGLEGESGYREASLNRIVKLTTGKDFMALSREEQDRWFAMAGEFKAFSEWIKANSDKFGEGFNFDDINLRLKLFLKFKEQKPQRLKPVEVDSSDPAFQLFQSIFNKNKSLNDGYKLTDRRYIGRLEKVNNKMQDLQKKWNKSKVGQAIRVASNWREMAAEKIVAVISKALSKALGITAAATGVLAEIAPVIQAVAEKAIKKGIDYAVATIKGMVKFDFKDLDKMLQKDLRHITHGCLMITTFIVVILFVPITALFGTVVSTTSPIDNTRSTSFGEEASNYAFSFFSLGTCVLSDEVLNDPPPWYYSQCDPTWSSIQIDSSPYSVGSAGCTLTTIAMVYKYFGFTCINPGVVVTSGPFGPSANIPSHYISDWDGWLVDESCIPEHGTAIISEFIGIGGRRIGDPSTLATLLNWFQLHPDGLISLGMLAPGNQHWVILYYDGSDIIILDPYPTVTSNAVSTFPGAFANWTATSTSTGYFTFHPLE